MKLYSLYLDDIIEDHWSYPVEMIEGEDALANELAMLKQDIIDNPEQYDSLTDVEVIEVDENGDAIEYGVYNWLDDDDCPQFIKDNDRVAA